MNILLFGIGCLLAIVIIALFLSLRLRRKAAGMMSGLVAVSSLVLYFYWSDAYYHFVTMADEMYRERLLADFETHLMENGGVAEDWGLLAKMYAFGGQYDSATTAYEQAEALGELSPEDKIAYAETLFLSSAERFNQKSIVLLDQALSVSPNNERGLWLRGFASFTEGDYQAAINRWTYLRRNLEDGSEAAAELDKQIADAGQMLGEGAIAPEPDEAAVTVAVAVTLAEHLQKQVAAEDTLFVYARAVSGPPLPLAIKRLTVADLPAWVTLSSDDAMMPAMTLRHFDPVKVIARISKSGKAKKQPGDLYGESMPISPQARSLIAVEISEIVKDGEHD